jgi:hypothetical protein
MLTAADSGMVVFRSGYTGFMDLGQDAGVRHFAGHRLGCWINAVPANGLVMIPEASAGCVCLFSIASTIVLEPREARRPWTIYSSVGVQTPVEHLAVNLGAPGDRKDAHGTLWLSYPRYRAYRETSLDIKMDLKAKFAPKGEFQSINENAPGLQSEETPWLYSSWADGLNEITLPLLGKNDAPTSFTVQLHFANARKDGEPSQFDVTFNGEAVLENVELLPVGDGEADQKSTVVHEIKNVKVTDNLVIELVAKQSVPVLNAIQIIRER